MQIKQFSSTAKKFSMLQSLAIAVQSGARSDIDAALSALATNPAFQTIGWQANFAKLAHVFATGEACYSVFALSGNEKLGKTIVAFSSLPGVTCPGAGDCLIFCYSFRAWRYPAAFARMVQNAFLMRFAKHTILSAFQTLPHGADFRLYVDGDFAHGGDVAFWMQTLITRPDINAYGYSKSFAALLGYDAMGGQWPKNYMLNISSGHNASAAMVKYVRALPITRGEFIAVSIGKKVKGSDHGTPETNKALRAAVGATKIFPCPGACGKCTGKGHACGLTALKGITIAIAIH